jgi:hypothetical protein
LHRSSAARSWSKPARARSAGLVSLRHLATG